VYGWVYGWLQLLCLGQSTLQTPRARGLWLETISNCIARLLASIFLGHFGMRLDAVGDEREVLRMLYSVQLALLCLQGVIIDLCYMLPLNVPYSYIMDLEPTPLVTDSQGDDEADKLQMSVNMLSCYSYSSW
jgi:hypothetical protein